MLNRLLFWLLLFSSLNYGQPQFYQYKNMSLVKQIVTDSFYPLDVIIKDNFLLAINGNEIEVYDIDNPVDPILLNKQLYTSEKISFPKIEIVEKNGIIIGNKRILIFDLSLLPEIDFSNLTDFTVDDPFNISGFLVEPYSIKDNKIYYSIGTYEDGSILSIIDIQNPIDPKVVGTYQSSQRINGVMNGNGDYLYLACLKGIRIMDVADSSNPKLLTIFDEENDYALGISYNDYIIVNKVFDGSLRVFDVSDSENPTEAAYFYGGNFINHIKIFNSFLHTSSIEHPSSLYVYNLEDLTDHGRKAEFYNGSKGHGAGIAITQNIIYYCGLPNADSKYEPNHGLFVLKNNLITSTEEITKLPTHYSLSQNYPNPFNPSTVIKYQIPNGKSQNVNIKVYDVLGKEVATLVNKEQLAGSYGVEFNTSASSATANSLSSGVYFYRLRAGSFVETKKMLLIR